ncbi:MAG TPA: ferrous iron transport protein A [Firmicutes bacterium]|nr:ferrous iron transport protein A [Bacillota bacterium]
MSTPNKLTLICSGVPVRIVDIVGGFTLEKKLESLGIRKGVLITKLTSQFGRGPITISIGKTQVALGYGMADKIIVEASNNEPDNSGR